MNASPILTVANVLELSPAQQGILFEVLAFPRRAWHEEMIVLDLRGPMNVEAFTAAWAEVIARHEALRASFHLEGLSKPVQVIHADAQPAWVFGGSSGAGADQQPVRACEIAQQVTRLPISLSQPPVMHFALFGMGEDLHRFVWKHHHIILDGWSVGIVFREVFAVYDALARGLRPALPPARPLSDYIEWLQRQDTSGSSVYWRTALGSVVEPTRIGRGLRPWHELEDTDSNLTVDVACPLDMALTLERCAEQWRVSPVTVVHGIWALLLSHWCETDDVTWGGTYSGRTIDLDRVETSVGLLMNTLPVRVRVDRREPLGAFFQRVHRTLAEVGEHQWNALGQAYDWSGTTADAPLFDSIVVVENYPNRVDSGQVSEHLAVVRAHSIGGRTAFPVVLMATVAPSFGLRLIFDTSRVAGEAPGVAAALLSVLNSVIGRREMPPPYSASLGRRPHDAEGSSRVEGPAPNGVSMIEERLAELWREVLGLRGVDVCGPFFSAGGHSLSAMRLLDRVRAEFGVDIPLSVLFKDGSTITGLARVLEDELIAQASDDEIAEELARLQIEDPDPQ